MSTVSNFQWTSTRIDNFVVQPPSCRRLSTYYRLLVKRLPSTVSVTVAIAVAHLAFFVAQTSAQYETVKPAASNTGAGLDIPEGSDVITQRTGHLKIRVRSNSRHDLFRKSLCLIGEGFFDYSPHRANEEAEFLAMVLSGELRAPDMEYERIFHDLRLIRSEYPILETTIDPPDFSPNQLLVRLFDRVEYPGFNALNSYFQVIDDRVISPSSNIHLLTFCDNINARQLRWEYESLIGEVRNAEPNAIGGLDVQLSISLFPLVYRYTIVYGFGDCPSSCICKSNWVIDVHDDGTLTLVSYVDNSSLSICVFEETVCCFNDKVCQQMPVGSCLDQNGVPQSFDATCNSCD